MGLKKYFFPVKHSICQQDLADNDFRMLFCEYHHRRTAVT